MTLAGDFAKALRRIIPAFALFLFVVGLVLLLSSLDISLVDASSQRHYGHFAVGLAGALLFTRILDVLLFDVGYRLRRGTVAPALVRQVVSMAIFLVLVGALSKVVLSAKLGTILTTSAIITAVIGLALQETLSNLFSGVALAMERTVQVGDMLRLGSSEGGVDEVGLVEQLTWRAIKVRTMEGNSVLIPNTVASRDRLEVFRRSGPPMARLLYVGLEYDLPPARARAELEAALRDLPGLASFPAPNADLHNFDASWITYELKYWLEDFARYEQIDAAVRERVWYHLERKGIAFAYPLTRQLRWEGGKITPPDRKAGIPQAIGASEFFAPLSAEERSALVAGAQRRLYTEGEVIVREGDTRTSSMFLIAEGRVAIAAHGAEVRSRDVAALGPGDAFGEISLLTGAPRLATAKAVTETTLVEIDKETLAPLLHSNPSLVEKLERVIQERRRGTADELDHARAEHSGDGPQSLRLRIARFFGLKGLV